MKGNSFLLLGKYLTVAAVSAALVLSPVQKLDAADVGSVGSGEVLNDHSGPVISGWGIISQGQTLAAGDTLYVYAYIQDESGISPREKDCVLQLYNEYGRNSRITIGLAYNGDRGRYEGGRTITDAVASGTYRLSTITAVDIFGNRSTVSQYNTPSLLNSAVTINTSTDPAAANTTEVTSFRAWPATMLLNPGVSANLYLHITPASMVDELYSLQQISNSNPAVATLSNGAVTAHSPGTTAIVLQGTIHGQTYRTQCVVTVTSRKIQTNTVPYPDNIQQETQKY